LDHHVAQLNVALPKAALDASLLADFVALLEPVNALADRNPPFVWRLQTEEGDATGVRALGDERLIENMSVWESLDALRAFRLREQRARAGDGQAAGVVRAHGRRFLVLWWVPAGHIPFARRGRAALDHLRTEAVDDRHLCPA